MIETIPTLHTVQNEDLRELFWDIEFANFAASQEAHNAKSLKKLYLKLKYLLVSIAIFLSFWILNNFLL